jgi:DNA-binding Xre family transcriptional regulator
MKNNNESLSTFDKLMKDPKWKKDFDKGYEEFLISEFLIEAMEENKISVRKLAEKAGVSPTVIQNLRSGKRSNISLNTLSPILSVLHYRLEFVKDRKIHKINNKKSLSMRGQKNVT